LPNAASIAALFLAPEAVIAHQTGKGNPASGGDPTGMGDVDF
jgi:hypothetical protein